MAKRSKVISGILGLAAVLAIGAWAIGSRIESPADAAARTEPPVPSAILVPIEQRELSSNIVTRGKARFGLPQPITLAPSVLKATPGLITSLPLRNKDIGEGAVLLTATRPDSLRHTLALRSEHGPVAVFDPQGLAGEVPRLRWAPQHGCADPLVAITRARAQWRLPVRLRIGSLKLLP